MDTVRAQIGLLTNRVQAGWQQGPPQAAGRAAGRHTQLPLTGTVCCPVSTLCRVLFYIAQHHDRLGNTAEALQRVDECIQVGAHLCAQGGLFLFLRDQTGCAIRPSLLLPHPLITTATTLFDCPA